MVMVICIIIACHCFFCVAAEWLRCDSSFTAEDMTVQCTCDTKLTDSSFSVKDLF